jgi:chromosome segregation protein
LHVKRLEIAGFKTFADRTELDFNRGITSIVGPNGVGKSNVADAVMWVLGEQSRKALRSATSQDVIFAGSGERSQLGLAEVALTLDNSDGALPIDFSEVTITRRLFRSGEAEYLINKSKCRLKDIQDLFMDTGLGAHAYSVVTQGEIDTILSIRAEDRRLLLEGVAGINKYRLRRDESTRKLAATQANITRLSDIIHELRSQRQALEKPALLAKEYNTFDRELRAIELDVLVCQYRRHRRRVGGLAHERDLASRDATAVEAQLNSVTAEHDKLRDGLRAAENELSEITERATAAAREADRARAAVSLAEERLRSAADRSQTWAERSAAAAARQDEYAERATRARISLAEMQASLATRESELAEKQRAYDDARAQAADQRRAIETQRAELTQMREDAARLEHEAQALESVEADLGERRGRLENQREAMAARAVEITESLAEARRRAEAGDAEVAKLAAQAGEARADLANLKQTLHEHADKLKILESAAAETESRCRVLSDFAHVYDASAQGVTGALKGAETGELSGIRGVVGDVLHVPARFEAAIEAALGPRLQWIIVDSQEDARRAISYLREKGLGRATFLPLSSLARVPVASAMIGASSSECLGVASRLVRVPAEFQKAIDYLLRDVYVVTDLNAALQLHRRLVFQARCITLEGEIVEKCGAVEGGSGARPGVTSFARRRELETALQEVDKLKAAHAAMVRVRQRFESAGDQIGREVAELEERLTQARAALGAAGKDVSYLEDHSQAAVAAQVEIDEELAALGERLEVARARRAASLAQAAVLRERHLEVEQQVSAVSAPEAEEAFDGMAAELSALRVAIADLRARCRAAEAELQHAEEQRDSAAREIAAAQDAVQELERSVGELREQIESQTAVAEQKSAEAEAGAASAREQRDLVFQLRTRADRLDQALRALMETHEAKKDLTHRAEVGLGREEAEMGHIVERLRDQFGLTPDEAETQQSETINETEITRRADDLRRKIRALGVVNPGADEEYERLKAREDTLDEQKHDLEQSREDLLKIIAEIDEETKSVFLDAFQRVSVEFDDLFKRLFGGGETKLVLTQPDNVLETGVDVIVKPPGKKQQHLLLLSGGERAMTALALLLAMLRVRPTPFCVMDEIDAPLDAMNTGRFVKLLEEFVERTQFIIITHNARTMEAANTLYGVTMQQAGVSKIISVELSEAQKEAEQWQKARGARGRRPGGDDQTSLDLEFGPMPARQAAPQP